MNIIKWHIRDWFLVYGVKYAAYLRLIQYLIFKYFCKQRAVKYLFDAHRYFYGNSSINKLVLKIVPESMCEIRALLSQHNFENCNKDSIASRTIVLKNPVLTNGHFEKGVIKIKFTETFAYYHQYIECKNLLKYFSIVLEPSWSGYCLPEILGWLDYPECPIVVEATEKQDFSFIQQLGSNLTPVDFGASDWVDFRRFTPDCGLEKDIDVVYVANCNPIKRHHLFFRAIRDISAPGFQAALVLANFGGSAGEINDLIYYYGIQDRLKIYRQLSQTDLNKVLQRSKVNVLLSYKEGSNKSLFEGFFAGVPGIALRNNIGINKNYINRETGLLVSEHELKDAILYISQRWREYTPREWAMANISPLVTTSKLNACLKSIAEKSHEPWTMDIVPHANTPEMKYFNPQDAQRFPCGSIILELFNNNSTSRWDADSIVHKLALERER